MTTESSKTPEVHGTSLLSTGIKNNHNESGNDWKLASLYVQTEVTKFVML